MMTQSVQKDDNLRQLQLIELDILKQFLDICQAYQLRYYMLGGTLLGAVRHGVLFHGTTILM